ncbi:MAG TPA: CoA transferase [Gammaproteobacteria bacterium]|nr:CoA transferase [Gammaproteobacteria bacterium]HIK68369.1 CoA transferase [Pseudomonadales bacterium]
MLDSPYKHIAKAILMQEQPLSGVTVLDFGQVYNGPYCGFLLAQAGARVIKVESLIGETLRSRGAKSTASYPFAILNVNKESITLNIKSAQGQALLKQLVTKVDVVLENFAPGTMAKYGIGADQLRACNPQLIYASSTGYGNAPGPYRDYLGMDITLQAMTGVMSITGEEHSTPLKTAAAFADFIAGTHLYAGIVTALFAREHSFEGASVDISMQDCVFPTLATALGSFYLHGEPPKRAGNRHPGRSLAPYNVYVAADGHVAIIAIREGHWRKLCTAMGRSELIDDHRYKDFTARCENMQALDAEITRWTATHTRAEILAQTQAHGVICAPVQDLQDVVNDPHLQARGTLKSTRHEHLGSIAQMQTAIRFTDIDPPELTEPPGLGAHTRRVLAELAGLSDQDIDVLYQAEAI